MSINASQYRKDKFVIGIDTEKVLGTGFSGYNSKSGDLTVLRMKPLGNAVKQGNCNMHFAVHYASILNILDSGCSVLE